MSAVAHLHPSYPEFTLMRHDGGPRCQGLVISPETLGESPPRQCSRRGVYVEKVPGHAGEPPVHFCDQHAPTRRAERFSTSELARTEAVAERERQARATGRARMALAEAAAEALRLCEEWADELPGPLPAAVQRYIAARNGARVEGLI